MNPSKILITSIIIGLALVLGKGASVATAVPRPSTVSTESEQTGIPAIAGDAQAAQSQAVYLPLVQTAGDPTGSGEDKYRLTINSIGQGSVIASPAKMLYTQDQAVTLSVIAAAGWKFVGWSGHLAGNDNPATLTMQSDRSVTAQFTPNTAVPTPTDISGSTPTHTPLPLPTALPTATFTPTFTPIPPTNTPVLPTNTPVPLTNTTTPTPSVTYTNTPTPSVPPTSTPTPSATSVNQSPVANAGTEQTITWPATASLAGTARDDGLPNGQLTVSWHKVTGPGAVTFTPVDQPTTTASFSTPGKYVLILIADDGALNASAMVAVVVNGNPPAAPSAVQVAAISPSEIQVTWTDNANNENGFIVDEGSTAFTLAADTTSFTHSDLTPNSYHCYHLLAFNDYGSSAWTDWAFIDTPPVPMPIESLYVRVQFEQRDTSAGRQQDVPFQVTIKDESGTQTLYQTANWVYPLSVTDGNYGTATLLPSNPALVYGQTYQILIRGAMHLTRRVTVFLTEDMVLDFTDPTVNPNGALWGCDINQDNQVEQADYDIWVAHVQAGIVPPLTPDADSVAYRADINGDHFIDIGDFSICAANLGKVGDQ